MNDIIKRPPLRYHGGKWKLAPWIIGFLPDHVSYIEPFGGGAGVLLQKQPSRIEVYNDINGDVVNFFRVLRTRPVDLIAAIDLTPYSRAEFVAAQVACQDELERARRFYVWSWQGRGHAGVIEPGGWRFMARATRGKTPLDDWNNNNHLWSVVQRLKQVHFEADDALKVIARFDDPAALFYVDPPYVQDTRCFRWSRDGYKCDYSDDDHRRLARVLHGVKGMAIISGYPSALYDELYGDWTRVDRKAQKDNGTKKAVECIWISPNAATKPRQMTMLDQEE